MYHSYLDILGYGDSGAPPKIPGTDTFYAARKLNTTTNAWFLFLKYFFTFTGGATLVFEVELLKIDRENRSDL
jgi:hypothetical protein